MKLAVYIHVGLRTRQKGTVKNQYYTCIMLHNDIKVTLYGFHIVHSRVKESCEELQCSADLCLTSRGYFVTTTQEGRNLKITLASYFCISCTKCTHGIIK